MHAAYCACLFVGARLSEAVNLAQPASGERSCSDTARLGHEERLALMSRGKALSGKDGQPMDVPSDFIFSHLTDFRPESANWDSYPELEVVGAGLLVRQMIDIMKYQGNKHGGNDPGATILEQPEAIQTLKSSPESIERLAGFLQARGSDKVFHKYHTFYAGVFDDLIARKAGPIQTLEVGLGTNNPELVSSMGVAGTPGASNRGFRDYLPPDSQINGADIDRDILYTEERIKTSYVDQLNRTTFKDLQNNLQTDMFDIIIDDGLHSIPGNLNVLLFGLENVKVGGWVVIEDIMPPERWEFWHGVVDKSLRSNPKFRTMFVKCHLGDAYLVQRLA